MKWSELREIEECETLFNVGLSNESSRLMIIIDVGIARAKESIPRNYRWEKQFD